MLIELITARFWVKQRLNWHQNNEIITIIYHWNTIGQCEYDCFELIVYDGVEKKTRIFTITKSPIYTNLVDWGGGGGERKPLEIQKRAGV